MAESLEKNKKHALTGWPMLIAWVAMIIFALHASTHMVGAGDTWVAMACGRHFINQGLSHDTVTVEPFSANSHKAGPTYEEIKTWPQWAQNITDKVGLETVKFWHPTGWLNQNWFTHVIFYWLTHLSPVADADNYSFNTLVYWKYAIYIITVICVYYSARLMKVNPALAATLACFALFIGRSFLDIRPAGFSNALTAILILVFALTTYRNILYIWLIVPMAVFWCNVHGGYLYLFMMLVPFTGMNFIALASKKRFTTIGMRGIYHTIAAGTIAFIAMIIFNPFHLTNLTHTFIISVSEHAEMWRTVNEWHPSFEWSNPVGTSFPYLILFILSIVLPILWIFSRLLKPKLLQAPKKEMLQQQKLITIFMKLLGYASAVLVTYTAFIAFAFIPLDFISFLICVTFAIIILLSINKNVHFIYLTVPLVALAMWQIGPERNYQGRYIYPYLIIPAYVIIHLITSQLSEKIKVRSKNILFVITAALASLILMCIAFNPLKVDNGWTLSSLVSLKGLWYPKYIHNGGLNYKYLLEYAYLVNCILIAVWLLLPKLKAPFTTENQPQNHDDLIDQQTYELPKIDLAMISIAALTIYMAWKSRRFIPIAGIAACPVIAMFIDQIIRIVAAAKNFKTKNVFAINKMSPAVRAFLVFISALIVLTCGIPWAIKYKKIYLNPSVNDDVFTSVFMRMTASAAKPFYACQFIRMNKLQGKMFNYWTEGGFVAYGQDPDPNTGKTPLQLFMDGRAQAAYEPETYKLWMGIMSGGPVPQAARARGQKLTAENYIEIGKWLDKQLKDRDVWITLMPTVQFRKPFVLGLEYHPDWQLVFMNDKQKILVDISTKQGRRLLEGIFTGQTKFPDEFSKNLIAGYHLAFSRKDEESHKHGIALMMRAFNQKPSQMAIQQILLAGNNPKLRDIVSKFNLDFLEKFIQNKDTWEKQDGFRNRIVAALLTSNFLGQIAQIENNTELADFYRRKSVEFEENLRKVDVLRW